MSLDFNHLRPTYRFTTRPSRRRHDFGPSPSDHGIGHDHPSGSMGLGLAEGKQVVAGEGIQIGSQVGRDGEPFMVANRFVNRDSSFHGETDSQRKRIQRRNHIRLRGVFSVSSRSDLLETEDMFFSTNWSTGATGPTNFHGSMLFMC